MKIAVSGASGFVGQSLVPLLVGAGAEVTVVGRDAARLRVLYPDLPQQSYDDFLKSEARLDRFVHLATVNNDAALPLSTFQDVNVGLTLRLADHAVSVGAQFINLSSFHALDPRNMTAYAATKREAAERLAARHPDRVTNLYLPAVYGDRWAGQLARLNRLPKPVAMVLFRILAAIKPTVHVGRLAEAIVQPSLATGDVLLADDQDRNLFFTVPKRIVDLMFAATVVVLLWWLLIFVWIAIKRDSPGPGIFAQARIGRHGRVFTCYKFRTMRLGTVSRGTHEVTQSAITRIGAFLRRTKIDELPQIWNIMRNEISLIGPRPCLPVQVELIAAREAAGVLRLKPGISGLAQVNDIDMSDPARLARWDARYAAMRSLLLDLKITLATVRGGGQGDRTKA